MKRRDRDMLRSARRARRFGRAAFGSLERRLVSGLLLIVIATLVLQLSSQNRSHRLHADTQRMYEAAQASERASDISDQVARLRLQAQRFLTAPGATASADEVVETAIAIEARVNAMRMAGIPVYRLPGHEALADLDRHVDAVLAARAAGPADADAAQALAARDGQLAEAAAVLRAAAEKARVHAAERLHHSTHDWHLVTSAVGALTILLVAAILFDLLRNVVPALRRLLASLKKLADGDLDIALGSFEIAEFQALSGALETFRKNALAVRDLAYADPTTGLPNRRAFEEQAGAALAAGPPTGHAGFAVLLADLDRFKNVNDEFGHATGDELVRQIGQRLGTMLGKAGLVARVGGDEIAMLVPLGPAVSPIALASDLVAAVRHPFKVDDYQISITLSLGLVPHYPDGSQGRADVKTLLRRAEMALFVAKQEGRNRACLFTPDIEEEREVERALERDLAHALHDGDLRMVYQPILPIGAAASSCGSEVEALVRWRHPELGEISPARFIPAAERSGLMVPLGEWIIERSLSDMRRWPDMVMSLNLSPLQLQQDGFTGFLTECCRVNGIAASRLILEVTETLSIESNTRALLTLNLLRNLGFRIALDDFGTGYSSLSMMKTFRFDRLKLDRSLIKDIGGDAASVAVLDAAVTMALRVGAEVVAEGISDEDLVAPVREAGCTHMQGFYYSMPIEAEDVAAFYADPARTRRVA